MIIAIIQARLGSTRLPKKVFADIEKKPLIWHVVDRLKSSKKIDKIIIATTKNPIDNDLESWAKIEGVKLYRGSENNVLERFYFAAKQYSADIVVRITADDPFKDPVIIDRVIDNLINKKLDFCYNNNPPTFPEGLDAEVFTFNAIERAYFNCSNDFEKEHVTQYMYKNKTLFKQFNIINKKNLSNFRWTIDTKLDYEMVKQVYKHLYNPNRIFLMDDILELLDKRHEISEINKNVLRSNMYK